MPPQPTRSFSRRLQSPIVIAIEAARSMGKQLFLQIFYGIHRSPGARAMNKLANKVALVTGGSRGIGAAIAKRLAADGASVALTYAKDAVAASAVVRAIELGGGKAIAIQADAADVEAVKSAVAKAVATFGRLDVLVNNAGTAIPKPFEETTLEEMDRVIDINIR